MEKLTQFVTKSFENNNNRPSIQNLLIPKTDKASDQEDNEKITAKDEPDRKVEDQMEIEVQTTPTKQQKPAKNWLISNSPKPQNTCTTYGMDLRVNPNGYPLIFGSSVQSICDIPHYLEQKSENEEKVKLKWFKDVPQPSPPTNYCCTSAGEQEDSVESNYDGLSRTKLTADNRSFVSEDEKNPGELIYFFT